MGKEDPEAGEIMKNKLREEGCTIYTNVRYENIESLNDASSSPPNINKSSKCKIHLKRTSETFNKPVTLDCDIFLLAAGRVPNVNGMGLENAKVKFDERRGVHIGPTMRTSNKRIYAVGDCCHPLQFTHMADQMARTVVKNACFFGSGKHTDMIVPRVTYTDPEVAQVGKNKLELAAEGTEFNEYVYRFEDNDRAICDGNTEGFIKFYATKGKPDILGCVIVCARAGEMIGEVALAMSNKLTLDHIYGTIHPYPTYGEGFRAAAGKYANTKLTVGAKVILRKLLKARA
jgi:pyruvate/2-oxoglutarate dehydrogenase complex dihydrolipoamide dehydrogenase (E3) component